MSRHHLFWPRRDYKTPLQKKFRNLPCNIVLLEIDEHTELHRTTPPPKMPERSAMQLAIERHGRGECKCRK